MEPPTQESMLFLEGTADPCCFWNQTVSCWESPSLVRASETQQKMLKTLLLEQLENQPISKIQWETLLSSRLFEKDCENLTQLGYPRAPLLSHEHSASVV